MVFRTALLIILFILFLPLDRPVEAREPSCLKCHASHYLRMGSCVSCHRGDPRSSRLTVAHQGLIPSRFSHYALPRSQVTKRGRRHLQTAGCRRCHLINDRGNRLAADLDKIARKVPPVQLFGAVRKPALLMPDFHFTETQINELVNALLAAAGEKDTVSGEIPRLIHFADDQEIKEKNIFSRKCGGCHRLLSPDLGGVGKGKIGPNLSGLLTEFYPRYSRDRKRWSAKVLRKWLENPRDIRPEARMPPVPLKRKELEELLTILEAQAVQGVKDRP